jgi:hypothetical protein
MTTNQLIWIGPTGLSIPNNTNAPQELIALADGLNQKQKTQVSTAFNDGAFDMGAEYVWRRTMKKLRGTLKGLGMKFIGEMLSNEDIDEYSNIETSITDFDTIALAENLGAISSTGALKLRQSLEVLGHYLEKEDDTTSEDFSFFEAQQIVYSCVKYVLGAQTVEVALEFSAFRDKLLTSTFATEDAQVEMLLASPYFYIRTIVSILLSAIKQEQGARQENALANINSIFVKVWPILSEKDKWNIGATYRDVTAKGDSIAVQGLKVALSKVKGFDYVPENLRSNTFIKAARLVINTHFSMNNFYNEPSAIKSLANLGTTIPTPALVDCLQAYLCIYLGNRFGTSWAAASTAENELKKISSDRWTYYFTKAIDNDDLVLSKFIEDKPNSRFLLLTKELLEKSIDLEKLPGTHKQLIEAAIKGQEARVKAIAKTLLTNITK